MKKSVLRVLLALVLLLAFAVPAAAAETEDFVFDVDGYLDEATAHQLDAAAKEISDQYRCGVYIAVFQSMADYGFHNIEEFGEEVYHSFSLGYSEEYNGILLVMSMEEREYDLAAYGDYAHYAFTDYGKEVLADGFLDNFRRDDWVGGYSDYVRGCGELLSYAAAGEPLDASYGTYSDDAFYDDGYELSSRISPAQRIRDALPAGIIVGIIVALIYCGVLKRKMKSAVAATRADAYVDARGVAMRTAMDQFSHTTVVRQHIDRSSSRSGGGGGTHINSGGFSHHSGKF